MTVVREDEVQAALVEVHESRATWAALTYVDGSRDSLELMGVGSKISSVFFFLVSGSVGGSVSGL